MNLIHLIIDVVVKLFVELVLNILRQIVVKVLVGVLRLGELREISEIWRVLETLHIHHIGELEIVLGWWHLTIIVVVHLPDVHTAKLIDIVVCHLINLPNLTGHLSELLGVKKEILLAVTHELVIQWLLLVTLGLLNDVLDALVQVL